MSVCVSIIKLYFPPWAPPHLNPRYSAGKEIDCFDCNSNDDPRCGDPFVFTAHARDMPAVKQCDGCCVKLVQHRGTDYESVRRTCTDEIDINLFMVDHVCMTEGGK